MKRALLIIVGVVVLIIAVVVIVGYALPQNHVATGHAQLSAPQARVFETLIDVSHYPEWRDDVSSVELLSGNPLRWRERSGGDVVTFEVVEARSPEFLRVRIADQDLPFGGSWTYELQPQGSGTRLTITENGEVYNPVFRFISRLVLGHTATIERYLENLQRRVASYSLRRTTTGSTAAA